ncbi:class I SAM-dependent methyltransferase [Alteromonas macleodii]|uniref:DUF4942 domain-containing protein n=1 Tax=Alteromonas macleodii TaxID=28108 RepID=A0AB36FKL4_ALTMA|nr:DUF4942 domain-containing protein [Alteromonas macleodii]OES24500.1 hypothetical protein BFV95_4767 [Alteromonas macleodii]OES25557.1 hypothetical protein BFV94_4410 [Alteromonas macleodii]OES25858.1 hypothetical protein BFV93_4321 [Alteromonas macleodii]OES38620.1 hypothetical protein BFV96_4731 [Alteromonas macleodii]
MQQSSMAFQPEGNQPHHPMTTLATVEALKQAGEDFEWYPTTDSQIEIICNDLSSLAADFGLCDSRHERLKLLDVGAGDARVLEALHNHINNNIEHVTCSMFAIEKAKTHIRGYAQKGVTLLGTEFFETNFISKNSDIAFSNPPYSQFESWVDTLLRQLNFSLFYVIMPERWTESEQIKSAMKLRGVRRADIIGESDFLDADRKARAKVHLVRFCFSDLDNEDDNPRRRFRHRTIGKSSASPFQLFIENELGLKKNYSDTTEKFHEHVERERVRKAMETEGTDSFELVASKGILWALLDSYERDLQNVLEQYKLISQLDPVLLQELGVDYDNVRKGVSEKLLGFRNVYWRLLFEQLDSLSSRLIGKHRAAMLDTLNANSLDFTYQNALYIIEYAVDLANTLIEQSIVDVYKDLTSADAIKDYYVSNQHVYQDKWRWNDENTNDKSKYLLDYRFIHTNWSNFGSHSWENGLNEDARTFMWDLGVVFKLLGYGNIWYSEDYRTMEPGGKMKIMGNHPSGDLITLVEIKFYKNGNRHLKFSQEAMLRFNVTASRVLGWVREKAEFDSETQSKKPTDDAVWAVGDSLKVLPSNVLALADKTTQLAS